MNMFKHKYIGELSIWYQVPVFLNKILTLDTKVC